MITPEAAISIRNLSKSFLQKNVIADLTLDIQQGSFVSIIGPSGCGKSTLLRLIAGLESVTQGEMIFSPTVRNSFSFVFQEANLLPWLTVLENVLLPFDLNISFRSLTYADKKERALKALKKVKLDNATELFPHELSGGMKMRVSLARALVSSPRLVLMDEPFAALDESTRFEMQNQLLELWQKEKMTILFVTHSLFESVYLSERLIMLKGVGAPKVLDQKINLPAERHEALRTSEALNSIVRNISERLRE